MTTPTLRLSGPVDLRDATLLLTLSGFMITARLPMSFVMLLLGPVAVIVVQGIRRRQEVAIQPIWWLVLSMLACSAMAALVHPVMVASFLTAVAIGLTAVACLRTGRVRLALDRLVDGIYLGLLFHLVVSLGEAATGIKILPILYPGANTAQAVNTHRFFVTSLFPNYNDYSVAMTLLVGLLVTRMIHRPRVHPLHRIARACAVLFAAFEITYMGSRGALLAMLLMVLVACVTSIRLLHPKAFGIRTVAFCLMFAGVIGLGLLNSPWLQDNSTNQRGIIAGNILSMMAASPLDALVGWGSYANYQAAATRAFGGRLMDPHNVVLETIVWFGLPTALVFLWCWWRVLREGLLSRLPFTDWRGVGAVTVMAGYPVLGIVPSSTLRYYLVWLFLLVALGRLRLARGQRAAEAPVTVA